MRTLSKLLAGSALIGAALVGPAASAANAAQPVDTSGGVATQYGSDIASTLYEYYYAR